MLGRGLRIPPGFANPPLVKINNHEKWTKNIEDLLKEVLEVENTLTAVYDPSRSLYAFPIFNVEYTARLINVQTEGRHREAPSVIFRPQALVTTEYSTFSRSGTLAVEIEHKENYSIEDAVKLMRLFIREKSEEIANEWSKEKLRAFIIGQLQEAGQDTSFLSKANFLLLQKGFGPMFREPGAEHVRISREAGGLVSVDVSQIRAQTLSESRLRDHGHIYYANDGRNPFTGTEALLWDHYQRLLKQYRDDPAIASDAAKAIAPRMEAVDRARFKMPRNVHFTAYEPERKFSDRLFDNAELFSAFLKMPDRGGYAFPYSYKPSTTGRTHTINENCNPDYFLLIDQTSEILVVETKADKDDANRNKAKCRDGLKHFETLNSRLQSAGEEWRYHFYFLSPEDYTKFFEVVRQGTYPGWKSSLMQRYTASAAAAVQPVPAQPDA